MVTPLSVGKERCDQDRLALYTLRVETHWSRELFPKQFPEWRPPAQWSRLVGKYKQTCGTLESKAHFLPN